MCLAVGDQWTYHSGFMMDGGRVYSLGRAEAVLKQGGNSKVVGG